MTAGHHRGWVLLRKKVTRSWVQGRVGICTENAGARKALLEGLLVWSHLQEKVGMPEGIPKQEEFVDLGKGDL